MAQTNNQTESATSAKTDEQKKAEKRERTVAKAQQNAERHAWVVKGTARWEESATKVSVAVVCPACGVEHRRFTSDAHQAALCQACCEAQRKERRKAKRQEKAAQRKAEKEAAEQAKAA